MRFFSYDLGIDLGTANVLINVEGKGIEVNEPSVVAVDRNSGKVIRIGTEARNMLGRTPGNVVAMHPLKNGVISDHEMTVQLLRELFKKTAKANWFTPKPRVVISVPSGVTEVEERTVINAAIEAGARRVYLIEEPFAAGLGAKLDLESPKGHMVVNIGCGTTDVAVLSLNGVALSSSINVAGGAFDEAIGRYIRREYNLIIGQTTAEDIKIHIGSVYAREENQARIVKGRDAKSGVPREQSICSDELLDCMRRPARQILEEVLSVLERTSPELVSDIAENGITLTGGGSQLWGMDKYLTEYTGIPCTLADDAASCVAIGCGISLSWINHMQEGPINIARKRLLKG